MKVEMPSRTTWFGAMIVVVLAAICLAMTHSTAEDLTASSLPRVAEESRFVNEAKDMLLYFEMDEIDPSDDRAYTMLLRDARETTIGGRGFITGVGVGQTPKETEKHWIDGVKVAYPIDKVGAMYIMSKAQFEEFCSKANERRL